MDLFDGNYLKLLFTGLAVSYVLIGILNAKVPQLPNFVKGLNLYGKLYTNKKKDAVLDKIQMSKSYFRHFYVFAILFFFPVILPQVLWVYLLNNQPAGWFLSLMDAVCGPNRIATVLPVNSFIGILLMGLQATRRFYDTQFVCVFSKNAKMNILQYFFAILYYPSTMMLILSEAANFAKTDFDGTLRFKDFSLLDLIGVVIFVWAWWHQHVTTKILANLRKNSKGEVVSQEYKIPQGDWFKYLSSPHCVTEIIMYFTLSLFLYANSGWWYIFILVMVNQVDSIILSHKWYQTKLKNFPKERKLFIPFVF